MTMPQLALVFALALSTLPSAVAAASADETTYTMPAGSTLPDTLARAAAGRSPLWLAWQVPVQPTQDDLCCFDQAFERAACRLESKHQNFGSRDGAGGRGAPLVVLVRWTAGKVERVRLASAG